MKAVIIGVIVVALVAGGIFFFMNKGGEEKLVDFEEQQKSAESAPPTTEVRETGFNAEILINPSVDNVISGIVTVSLTKAPTETNLAFFTIKGPGITEEGPNLGIDGDASGGWKRIVDTTEYENGLYEIGALAMPSGDSNPLGVATAQVLIQN